VRKQKVAWAIWEERDAAAHVIQREYWRWHGEALP
jgi:hypothetical protein